MIDYPIPSSLANLHGKFNMQWLIALLPVIVELQLNHPQGWTASQLSEMAVDLGAVDPGEILRRNKVHRTLDLFESVGYVERRGDTYILDAERVQAECRIAADQHRVNVTRGLTVADTLSQVAALGPNSIGHGPGPRSLVSRLRAFFGR